MSPRLVAVRNVQRKVRGIAAVVALVSLPLIAGCFSGGEDATSGVEGTIRLNFASWEPVATKDVLPALRDPWLAAHPKQDRMMISGDYFGAGSNAYAVLITKKDKQGRRVRLVVMKPTESGRFETYILQTESPMDTMPVIHTSKKNEYEVNVSGQNLTVPTEGVVYTRPDGQQKLFFWNVDRFTDIELDQAKLAPPSASAPPDTTAAATP